MKVEADSHSTSSGEGSNADSGRGPSEEGENNMQGKFCLDMKPWSWRKTSRN